MRDLDRPAPLAYLAAVLFAVSVALVSSVAAGCAALDRAGPSLGAVISRVDVGRLLECAQMPDWASKARCVGAEAATQGLRAAFDAAIKQAERARDASGPAGADDMSDDERADLATELDRSLDRLAEEIHATHVAPVQ